MKPLKIIICLVLCSMTALAQTASLNLDQLLRGYVKDGKVDYDGLRAERRNQLLAFADSLATVDPESLTKPEQIAFWLDAYNGLVVHQIVETKRQPVSARERSKFFRGTRYKVAGQSMTLDQIEHQALRPLANDPRVHFVLVCGANSCPPLQASSFLAAGNLEQRLEQATRDFINDPNQVQIDSEQRIIRLSSLFDWYQDDFDDVLKFVARYRPPLESEALSSGRWKIEYLDYDWSLNNAPASAKP